MRLERILMRVIMLGTVVSFIGCEDSPEMITCPDRDDRVNARIGRTKWNRLYAFGSVLIRYETETRWKAGLTNRPPAPAVRDFFAKKGYTTMVRGYNSSFKVVSIDSDVDPYPMLEDLRDLPGIVHSS